ncbi:hypothetical protein R5W24_004113, partial [Gemmata sp. JC717]|uniref:hypothetical protein n=1 Tax=Gemmata algarum TaxID=2975278 RepID=UPI0021BAF7D3
VFSDVSVVVGKGLSDVVEVALGGVDRVLEHAPKVASAAKEIATKAVEEHEEEITNYLVDAATNRLTGGSLPTQEPS